MNKIKINKTIFIALFFVIFSTLACLFANQTNAQAFCDVFPCGDSNNTSGPISGTEAGDLFTFTSGSIFIGFILVGVIYIIKAVIKIIRSQGDEAKIEEGMKIMKGVYIGIGLVIIGIIGLVILAAGFKAGDLFGNDVTTTPPGVVIPPGIF
ncbi:MAG: hypothetical protein Q9M91_05785 [Candidatus Dojkabacteria bacterium]|nr:hypothetical protein [Candidatus Dojkabacteria bacterium]MDQ7021310.1 hypothetical protein [Candidatus Dojkabacteria bacterium]